MNWPNWMKDKVSQFLIAGISIPIIGIMVGVVLLLWPSPPSQGPSIKGDDSIQVIDSPGTTIIKKEIDPEARVREEDTLKNTETIIQLIKKGIAPKQQLIDEREKKIQELTEELKKYTAKDKRAEEALVAFKAGNYDKARELFKTLREEENGKEKEHAETAYNLGNVYFVELDFSKSLEAYLDAVRLALDNSTYLNEVGYSFHTLAQYDKAIEYFEKAL